MKDSPLKQIILPFILNKSVRKYSDKWNDKGEQIIHIEPMKGKTFCAVTMKVVGLSTDNKYELKLDVKFENENPAFRVDPDETKTYFKRRDDTSTYHYDLHINVIPREDADPTHHTLSKKFPLKASELMDIHFTPPYLSKAELTDEENVILGSRRICKVRYCREQL